MIGEIGEIFGWFKAAFSGWQYLFSKSYRTAKKDEWKNEKAIYIIWDFCCGLVGMAFSVFLLTLAAYLVLDQYLKYENPVGYKNSETCESIKSGSSFAEVVKILGPPTNETEANNGTWYYFNTSFLAAGPIRIRANKMNNVVLELRCSEDGPSTWNVNIK